MLKIKKTVKTSNPKWPLKVVFTDGTKIKIPQQKQFNEFSQIHGCSLAAVSTVLQMYGKKKGCTAVYNWAKANTSGYSGSKLTIFGIEKVVNGMSGTSKSTWHPITASNKAAVITAIQEAVKSGYMVSIEQKSPVHTNLIIAKRSGGVWIATNGTVKQTTIKKLVNEALCGTKSRAKQANWWKGTSSGAGYVIHKF